MEARRKEEEKHNDQLEADRKAARTLQEKLNEENRMLREQIGKKEFFFYMITLEENILGKSYFICLNDEKMLHNG